MASGPTWIWRCSSPWITTCGAVGVGAGAAPVPASRLSRTGPDPGGRPRRTAVEPPAKTLLLGNFCQSQKGPGRVSPAPFSGLGGLAIGGFPSGPMGKFVAKIAISRKGHAYASFS